MSESAKLRWGILGAARVNERLLPAIAGAANAELVAIASRRSGAAADTLAKYAPDLVGKVRTYDDLPALLSASDIDAIYIPLANHEHAEWALQAIQHGKHVLCEKPMALTPTDIDTLARAAEAKQVKIMEGFMYRFHPQHARVQEIIASGVLGELRSVRSSYSFMMRPARMYRLSNDVAQGGGAMWDIGCYALHSLRMFFNTPPLAVTALAKYVPSGADISSSGVVDFGDGRFAQFDFSFERARRCEYEIVGTRGGLKCHVVWQLPGDIPVISWWTEDGKQMEERYPPANHFELEIAHFSACVLNDTPPALSLADAKENCRLIVAALQSAKEQRTISL